MLMIAIWPGTANPRTCRPLRNHPELHGAREGRPFRQINKNNPSTHHDAVEFQSGAIVMITHLVENQSLSVLQLPVAGHDSKAAQQASAVQV